MSKKLVTGLFAAALSISMLTVSGTASAQFVGPTQGGQETVAGVLSHPVDDQYVTLKGRVTSRISHEKYWFSDNTGTIRVEIDDDVFAGRQINPNVQIQISGKVDKEFFQDPKIDVKSLEIIGN